MQYIRFEKIVRREHKCPQLVDLYFGLSQERVANLATEPSADDFMIDLQYWSVWLRYQKPADGDFKACLRYFLPPAESYFSDGKILFNDEGTTVKARIIKNMLKEADVLEFVRPEKGVPDRIEQLWILIIKMILWYRISDKMHYALFKELIKNVMQYEISKKSQWHLDSGYQCRMDQAVIGFILSKLIWLSRQEQHTFNQLCRQYPEPLSQSNAALQYALRIPESEDGVYGVSSDARARRRVESIYAATSATTTSTTTTTTTSSFSFSDDEDGLYDPLPAFSPARLHRHAPDGMGVIEHQGSLYGEVGRNHREVDDSAYAAVMKAQRNWHKDQAEEVDYEEMSPFHTSTPTHYSQHGASSRQQQPDYAEPQHVPSTAEMEDMTGVYAPAPGLAPRMLSSAHHASEATSVAEYDSNPFSTTGLYQALPQEGEMKHLAVSILVMLLLGTIKSIDLQLYRMTKQTRQYKLGGEYNPKNRLFKTTGTTRTITVDKHQQKAALQMLLVYVLNGLGMRYYDVYTKFMREQLLYKAEIEILQELFLKCAKLHHYAVQEGVYDMIMITINPSEDLAGVEISLPTQDEVISHRSGSTLRSIREEVLVDAPPNVKVLCPTWVGLR